MTGDYDFSDTDTDTYACEHRRLFWLVVAPFSVVLIGAVAMGLLTAGGRV